MNNERLEKTIVLGNLKKHDYTVADYKMSKKEADIVIKLLEERLGGKCKNSNSKTTKHADSQNLLSAVITTVLKHFHL